MIITIIGWYGTETIGDRAILAGLNRIFGQIFPKYIIQLGSLYPFYSERAIIEDLEYHKAISNNKLESIELFPSLSRSSLQSAIKRSDLLAIGGGPLMSINEMYMLRYAFRFAKKCCVPCAVLGCGWGPFSVKEHENCAVDIIKLSDYTIFRDYDSLLSASMSVRNLRAVNSIDPAFFCAEHFRQHTNVEQAPFIAANFRSLIDGGKSGFRNADESQFIRILQDVNKILHLPVWLIPQNTFVIGGDDRSLFNKLAFQLEPGIVKVLNNPPTLTEVMTLYASAYRCIGMRFHSVVLQLVLSGRNMVLDYTHPECGKIISMLRQLKLIENLGSRYHNLNITSGPVDISRIKDDGISPISSADILNYMQIYVETLMPHI